LWLPISVSWNSSTGLIFPWVILLEQFTKCTNSG
jgi:hypothetical protein